MCLLLASYKNVFILINCYVNALPAAPPNDGANYSMERAAQNSYMFPLDINNYMPYHFLQGLGFDSLFVFIFFFFSNMCFVFFRFLKFGFC